MRNFLKIFVMMIMLAACSRSVLAVTTTNSLNISATVAAACGDGVIGPGEQCDNGAANGACPASCSATCTLNSCGGAPITCPPNCPPVPQTLAITNVSAAPACNTAVISWQTELAPPTTSAAAAGYVEYWLDSDPSNKLRLDAASSQAIQSLTLTNLTLLGNYSYTIHATDGSRSADSAINTFTVSCGLPAVGLTVSAQNRGTRLSLTYPSYNDIAGVTVYKGQVLSCPASGTVIYQSQNKQAQAQESVTAESPTNANVIYGYSACLNNSFGVYSAVSYGEAERTIAEVSGLSAVPGNQQITFSWTNPADNPLNDFKFSAAVVIRVNGVCANATGIKDGVQLQESAQIGFLDTNLNNNQTYYYKIFVENSYGEYSQGLCLSAAPSALPQARCVSAISTDVTSGQATINWSNPPEETGVFTFNGVKWQRSSACVSAETEGQNVYSGTGSSLTDSISDSINYYYTAFVNYNNNQTARCGCFGVIFLPPQLPLKPLCPECSVINLSPHFDFFVNAGVLNILPDAADSIYILTDYLLTISTPVNDLPKSVTLISLNLNGKDYFLAPGSGQNSYQAEIAVPSAPGQYPLQLTTVYADKTMSVSLWQLQVLPRGIVSDSQSGQGLANARIELLLGNNAFAGYGVSNPQTSAGGGSYALMVPNGTYRLKVSQDNYLNYTDDLLVVKNNIINVNISLQPAENLLTAAIRQAARLLARPQVKAGVSNVIAPALAAINLISVVSAIPWWNLWMFLQYMFTEPWWLVLRRKQKGWGVVYNSITKTPVGLAIVRLYDAATKRLLQSRVTDKEGRYIFLVDAGEYYLEAARPGFAFPSQILKNITEDNNYTNLYSGQMVKIAAGQHGAIIANIPLDQQGLTITNIEALRKYFWLGLKRNLAVVGPLLALVCWLIVPNWLTGLLLCLHLLLYALFHRLAESPKPKSWGVIYDKDQKKPLGKAVARIFSPEYDRMLDVYITDNYGRYGFLAGHNIYYLTADKDGYLPKRTDNLDLRDKTADDIVNQDLLLTPKRAEHPGNLPPAQPPESISIPDQEATVITEANKSSDTESGNQPAAQSQPQALDKSEGQIGDLDKNKEDIYG